MKEGVTIIFTVVLLLPLAPCPGAGFHFESKTSLFGLHNWKSVVKLYLQYYPKQYNPNIRVCAAHFMEDCFLNLGKWTTMLPCTKAVSIKWGNSNFARTV